MPACPKEIQKPLSLPASREEITARGWHQPDIVLVTGDAYMDHPSFGISLIGRWLEYHGYRVAVLAQPWHLDARDFRKMPPPRLFCGITAGNLDSIVANYTGNGRVREQDSYSPEGNPYFGEKKIKKMRRRPDRASIRYTALAREAWPGTPIILGGLEGSLRRFIHYDYKQERLRSSILTEAKADLLVYGMGERAALEAARRLERGRDIRGIAGTCERLTEREFKERQRKTPSIILPSWQETDETPRKFLAAERILDRESRALSTQPISQQQKSLRVWQNHPAAPLNQEELDLLYTLPFQRRPHPLYQNVPAWQMIKDSITIVRGCSGNCSFCAISRHQGPVVTSRSPDSIIGEVRSLAALGHFRGTITDLGGPTANLYATSCAIGGCRKHDCFYPKLCKNLRADEEKFIDLLRRCRNIPGVRHLHISSGLRMELLLNTPQLLKEIIEHHLPGNMKIAPEHTDPEILRLMHKPGGLVLDRFIRACRGVASNLGKTINFTPYLICSHPGCAGHHMKTLAEDLKNLALEVRQFQDFTPTPGTMSTAMYVSGLDRDNDRPIYTARGKTARTEQRQILEKITLKAAPAGKKKDRGIPKVKGNSDQQTRPR